MTVSMPAEEFFQGYADVLERVGRRGVADSLDLNDAVRLLAYLHGGCELRMSTTMRERDGLSGILVRTVVTGKLDEEATTDLRTTHEFLKTG